MFDRLLLATLFRSHESFGTRWAWRITRLLHAIPYLLGAFAWGWFADQLWGSTLPPMVAAWFTAGLVALGMCWSWLKEWWRGY